MNSTKDVVQAIEGAKDPYGLITSEMLHQQLNTLTAADWRAASQIYSEQKAGADGFYIQDTANGSVTIHNDIRQATTIANESLNQVTLSDMKAHVAGFVSALTIAPLGVAGATGFMSLIDTGVEATAAAAAGEAGLITLVSVPLVGGMLYEIDRSSQSNVKNDAQSELKMSTALTFQTSPSSGH